MDSKLKIIRSLLFMTLAGLTLCHCSLPNHNISPQRANVSLIKLSSGVQGQALRGPVHSGPPQAGDNAYIGFAALFYVNNDHGELVTTFYSDDFGWFRVELEPGNYEIIPDSSAPLLDAKNQVQQVTIVESNFSNVTLHFDSAM